METFNKYKEKLEICLNQKNAFTDVLEKIEARVKVSRTNIFLGLTGIVILYLIFGYAGQFLANFIGFVFPAYWSIKAIESSQKDDDTKWLTYWVVYAAFSLVEYVADALLFWIPLYALIKCIFLVYLMVPTKWNGSIYLYYSFIRPYVLKNQEKIDEFLNKTTKISKEVIKDVTETGESVLRERAMNEIFHEDKPSE